MAEPDYSDRETLQAWLKTQPREVSVVIAARAALRMLPMLSNVFVSSENGTEQIREFYILPVFRGNSIAWFSSVYPSYRTELREAANAANQAVTYAVDPAAYATPAATAVATYTIYVDSDERAASAAAYTNYVESDKRAFSDAVSAADATAALVQDTNFIKNDIGEVSELAIQPIWNNRIPDRMAKNWEELQNRLSGREDWKVWIRWYEARLGGGPTYPGLPAKINQGIERARVLEITKEDWKAGPAVVNRKIREIEARFGFEDQGHKPMPDQIDEEVGDDDSVFEQRPAAHRFFANPEGLVDASWQVGDALDKDVAADIHVALEGKVRALADRLKRTNAPNRICETLDRLAEVLGEKPDDIRLGGLLMSLRSIQADAEAYDTSEARMELLPEVISQIHDVAQSLDDFVALYPLARQMQAASIALKIQRRDVPKIRRELAKIRKIADLSTEITEAAKSALNYAEPEIEHESEIVDTATNDKIRAGAIDRQADLVALQTVDYRNFVSAVFKSIASARKWAGREAIDIGSESWKETKSGIARGVGKSTEAATIVILAGLAGLLVHPIAGLAVYFKTFVPITKVAKKIEDKQNSDETLASKDGDIDDG